MQKNHFLLLKTLKNTESAQLCEKVLKKGLARSFVSSSQQLNIKSPELGTSGIF